MSSRLTAREQSLLADIEHHLRREEPALDRRLARAPGPAARLTHRPRLLAAVIAVLSVLTAAGSLWAGAGGRPGGGPARRRSVGAALRPRPAPAGRPARRLTTGPGGIRPRRPAHALAPAACRTGRKTECIQYEAFRPARREHAPDTAGLRRGFEDGPRTSRRAGRRRRGGSGGGRRCGGRCGRRARS
ncbi:DUF3040 domain-containing protein [Kitasatospora cheerisanensis]|uniref:DUF3040 domain-containing protein n=1 Tax=Kitasatospora cheerisanensis TaxID=81942 RepID=UPI000A06442E